VNEEEKVGVVQRREEGKRREKKGREKKNGGTETIGDFSLIILAVPCLRLQTLTLHAPGL